MERCNNSRRHWGGVVRLFLFLAIIPAASAEAQYRDHPDQIQPWFAFEAAANSENANSHRTLESLQAAAGGIDKPLSKSFSISGSLWMFGTERPGIHSVWSEIHGSLFWYKALSSSWYFREANTLETLEVESSGSFWDLEYVQRVEIGRAISLKGRSITPAVAWQPHYDFNFHAWQPARTRFVVRIPGPRGTQLAPFYEWKGLRGPNSGYYVGLLFFGHFPRAEKTLSTAQSDRR